MPPLATETPAKALDYGLRGRIFDVIERVIVMALLGLFLARFAVAPSYHMHDLLIVAAELLVGVFILARRRGPPVNDGIAWSAALIGAGAPLLVVPGGAPVGGDPLISEMIGSLMMTLGFFMNLSAKLFLRRSFGLVAANRGVKVDGPYRLVRHPMYAGYLLTHVGFLLAGFAVWNLWVYLICWAAMIVRIRAEENVLSLDSDYAAYVKAVRFRLIPGVW